MGKEGFVKVLIDRLRKYNCNSDNREISWVKMTLVDTKVELKY